MKDEITMAYDVLRRRVAMRPSGELVNTLDFGMLRQLQHAANASGLAVGGHAYNSKEAPSAEDVERACAVFLWSLTAYPQG